MTANEIKKIQELIEKTTELRDALLDAEISDETAEVINTYNHIDFLSHQINEMKWQVRVAEEKLKAVPKEEKKKAPVRFLMYKVTNGKDSVKIDYSRISDTEIKVYASSYVGGLCRLLDNVIDNTDSMTDYFEYERVRITTDSPYWKQVNAQCTKREAKSKNNY